MFVYKKSPRILAWAAGRVELPLDEGRVRFGGRNSGVPKPRGRKCFKRGGVAMRFSSVELTGVFSRSSCVMWYLVTV